MSKSSSTSTINSEVSHNAPTFVEILKTRASQFADKRAYSFLLDGESKEAFITYAEMDRKARVIASALRSRIAAGDRALLAYGPGLEFIAGFMGCLYAGVVAVPTQLPTRKRHLGRFDAIARDCGAAVALTTSVTLPALKRIFEESSTGERLELIATDVLNDAEAGLVDSGINAGTLAFLQYTSGSTGTPKGVMLTHANLLHNQRMMGQAFEHDENSLVVGWLPMFHDMGLIGNLLHPLYKGIPSVLMAPNHFLEKPFRWLQAISRYGATTSGGPNFAYDLCVEKITPEQLSQLDLSSWTVAFNGSEPVRSDTLKRFSSYFAPCGFSLNSFYPCYGMAEATLFISGGDKGQAPVVKPVLRSALDQNQVINARSETSGSYNLVGCGHSRLDQKIAIVNSETLALSGAGAVGEIWVSGGSVAQGYWNKVEETESAFNAYLAESGDGPFLRTGDLGFYEDEQLFITGRIKDLIIIRGRNLYPEDIEATVKRSHPHLNGASCAAFSLEVDGEEQLVIVQELKREFRNSNVEELIDAIRTSVTEEHEVRVHSAALIKQGHIPKTSSGKVQRHLCRRRFLDNALPVIARSEGATRDDAAITDALMPETALQTAIANAWEEVLNIRQVALHDNFFEIGGDSLRLTQVASRLKDRLALEVSVEDIFEKPTVAALADHLESVAAASPARPLTHIKRLSRYRPLRLSFAQQRL
ncbi:MAG TPA: AMP-binding protein, partial [Blastocatellia bacterium]